MFKSYVISRRLSIAFVKKKKYKTLTDISSKQSKFFSVCALRNVILKKFISLGTRDNSFNGFLQSYLLLHIKKGVKLFFILYQKCAETWP